MLTLSTLSIWLKESGVSHTTLGLFVLATLPYTFKFVWGPLVDHIKIPYLFSRLGQRRSWILLSQAALIAMLIGLGSSSPQTGILETAFWAFGVALCSAIQDVVIEAYRIEATVEDQLGPATSATVLGWRFGMMTSGAGALFLAATFSWSFAYNVMAALMLIGMVTTLLSASPRTFSSPPAAHRNLWYWISSTYGQPLKELWLSDDWRIILSFIFLYKVGDTTLNVMNTPFLVDLGFSKLEIANVAKLFGISAMIVGGFIGGLFLSRFGLFRGLLLCTALQCLSSLMFLMQATVGYHLNLLIVTIGIENLTCGFGATAFIAYLSSLCSLKHTATHFAILSSFGSLMRIVLSIGAGILADRLSWPLFFTVTGAACLPCFCLLLRAAEHFGNESLKLPQTASLKD